MNYRAVNSRVKSHNGTTSYPGYFLSHSDDGLVYMRHLASASYFMYFHFLVTGWPESRAY